MGEKMTLHDRVEFALRDAGFDLDEASRIATLAESHLTQPAQAEGWRDTIGGQIGRLIAMADDLDAMGERGIASEVRGVAIIKRKVIDRISPAPPQPEE